MENTHYEKLAVDFVRNRSLRALMNEETRDLINRLGSELSQIMEDASAMAAFLRGVPPNGLCDTLEALTGATRRSQELVGAMRALALTSAPQT